MTHWFDSASSPATQRTATPRGDVAPRQDHGPGWSGVKGKAFAHAPKAHQIARAAARQGPVNEITVRTLGCAPASFQRDAHHPRVWMAVAAKARGKTYQARVIEVHGSGSMQWLPLVDTPGVQTYATAQAAMEFALAAAHQRMEGSTHETEKIVR